MAGELVEHEGPTAAAEELQEDDGRSIVLALQEETHTLGNALRDVMWSHPHVQLASYTQEHPSSQEILLRCQTSGAISAEQGVAEALQMMQQMLAHMGEAMEGAVAQWQAQQPAGQAQQQGQQQGKQRQQRQEQQQGGGGGASETEDEDVMEEDS